MNPVIYPVIGRQTALPFYISGIGVSEYEYHACRRDWENSGISRAYIFRRCVQKI